MHQDFLSYRRYLWGKITLGMMVLLVVSYILYSQQMTPGGGTVMGFLYGVLGSLAICLLMYYGRRKRAYMNKSWSLQGWLSFHCYIGVLALVLIAMHTGFKFHANIHTLAFVLLVLVVGSGIVGAFLYYTVPRRFGEFGPELMYVGTNTIDREFQQLLQQMHALARDKSNPFARKCQEETEHGLPTRPAGWRLLFRRTPLSLPGAPCIEEFKVYLPHIPADEHADFLSLGALAAQKRELARRLMAQMRLQNLLESWLYVHLPVSMAMLVAIVIHITVVFYHGYRLP